MQSFEDFDFKAVGKSPAQQNHDNAVRNAPPLQVGSESVTTSALRESPTPLPQRQPFQGRNQFGWMVTGPSEGREYNYHTPNHESNNPWLTGNYESPEKLKAALGRSITEPRDGMPLVEDDTQALKHEFSKFLHEEEREGEHDPQNLKKMEANVGEFLTQEGSEPQHKANNRLAPQ